MTRARRLHRQGPLTFRVIAEASPRPSASPTFVLVHGIGMSHRSLARLHDALSEHGAAFSIDLPGHAGLPKPRMDVDVPTMARGLAGVIASLDVGPVVLIGHSMGAQWITAVARENPELVERVVLIGPVVDPARRTLTAQAAALARDSLGESPRINAIVSTDYLRCGTPWFLAQARHMVEYPIEEEVARLAVPVLVIRGAHDPIAKHEWCRVLSDRARYSTLVAIPRHRHVVQHSAAGAVAAAILSSGAGQLPTHGSAVARDLLQHGAWWARDYAYALVRQGRALLTRVDPDSFLTGARRPVIVLPGIYETWQFMQPVIDQLHALGHPVHIVADLRRNHRPVAEMAEQVASYLRAHGLDDVLLVAHSKGGLAGKLVMTGPEGGRVRGMLAIATPFSGSRYARLMLLPSLRAFSSRDPAITSLADHTAVNGRIVSVYARFDPHIPGGSELPGATNVALDTGGHFRILAHSGVLAELATFAD